VTDAEKARTAGMFDQLSSTYGEIVPFFSYFGERLVAAAGVAEGAAVLDVASGLGACLLPAAAIVGEDGRVVGVDISGEMVDALNRAIETSGCRNANVQLMDAEALRFADDSFDSVTCAFAVFFFPDRVRALSEFARVLKPGGTVALSTFADETLGYRWFADVIAPSFLKNPLPFRNGHTCG
jgi:ubiquinone/menaquinone biosynthesis C-methylase UbiE